MPSKIQRLRKILQNGRTKLLPSGDAVASLSVLDMILHNWHLGVTSFGGPTVHFQIFNRLFAEKYQWLDEQSYQEMFALCQALSGPGSTKMHYAINVLHYGFWIGVLAFSVWSLPMAMAAFGLGLGVANIGDELPAPAYALLSGLNAATVGIVALAAVQLSSKAITDTLTRVLVFFGTTAGALYNTLWYFPVLLAGGGLITVLWDSKLLQKLLRSGKRPIATEVEGTSADIELAPTDNPQRQQMYEEGLHQRHQAPNSVAEPEGFEGQQTESYNAVASSNRLKGWKQGTLILMSFFVAFTIVMVVRGTLSGRTRGFDVFANLFLAGTIIFGGGPVVIPLLREYVVAEGWVSPRDFLLGLAITQAFPGPNFNFAVYLGSLAIAEDAGGDVPRVVGAILAYIAIFTPDLWLHTGTNREQFVEKPMVGSHCGD
ncbi:chromate transporter [Hortaea werneckii]|nr:chromate transporter [Hortaea werneckii]